MIVLNPTNDEITLFFELSKSGPVSIQLVNNLGQIIETWVENYQTIGKQKLGINISQLSQGMYHVWMLLPEGCIVTKKFLISQ